MRDRAGDSPRDRVLPTGAAGSSPVRSGRFAQQRAVPRSRVDGDDRVREAFTCENQAIASGIHAERQVGADADGKLGSGSALVGGPIRGDQRAHPTGGIETLDERVVAILLPEHVDRVRRRIGRHGADGVVQIDLLRERPLRIPDANGTVGWMRRNQLCDRAARTIGGKSVDHRMLAPRQTGDPRPVGGIRQRERIE